MLFKTEEGEGKTQPISYEQVEKGYRKVRSNGGAGGVDGMEWEEFDKDKRKHLYKLWNRMASGCYFPQAVREHKISKGEGKTRSLGIPTLLDRIAQQVVVNEIEPRLEAIFHENSYGYRSNKNAHQAVELCKQRCWKKKWVIDLDIEGFFDNIDHELLMKAVRKQVEEKWILLYIERWLKAPVHQENGEQRKPQKGTPQGSCISPTLANLFLHYSFDEWIKRGMPDIKFERYADDIIVHCESEKQANDVKNRIEERMKVCRLKLHAEKTKIVYCQKWGKNDGYENVSFDFLGFTFKPRTSKTKEGKILGAFGPGVSKKAVKKMMDKLRSRKIHGKTSSKLTSIAADIALEVRGWINYYCRQRKSAMERVFKPLNDILVKWWRKKYKVSKGKAISRLSKVAEDYPNLFVHWTYGFKPTPIQELSRAG